MLLCSLQTVQLLWSYKFCLCVLIAVDSFGLLSISECITVSVSQFLCLSILLCQNISSDDDAPAILARWAAFFYVKKLPEDGTLVPKHVGD